MTPAEFRTARKRLGLRQAELAAMLGLASYDGVSKIERGQTRPGQTLIRLMEAYLRGDRPPDWPTLPPRVPLSLLRN